MRLSSCVVLASLVLGTYAQSDTESAGSTGPSNTTATATATGADYATSGITYANDDTTLTITGTDFATITDPSSVFATVNGTLTVNSTALRNATATSSPTETLLVGGAHTTTTLNGSATLNQTASPTTATPRPTNTVPCNGYPQFCNRKFSNITHVGAHNSPFVRPGNLASNQMLDVETQLNDGIRMLQFQTHLQNGILYLCHTSCEILNVGTLEAYLTTVTKWLRKHPYDVIAMVMGNYDVVNPLNYTAPVINSGLINFVYTPPTSPMPLDSWPTLAEMIFRNERAIVMLDYEANQTAIPWLLDEFSMMWETPFSPTDRDFPCTAQRPPDRPRESREDRMYMANHNLNIDVTLADISLDVPATPLLNETNAVSGYGSAGAAVGNCTEMWNRPPTFLLVDYYNIGNFNGSVFQVAADANNVTYDTSMCCGTEGVRSAAGKAAMATRWDLLVVFAGVSWVLSW